MHSMICVEWTGNHFGLGLTYIDSLLTKMCVKKLFLHFSFPVILNLTFRPKIASFNCSSAMFPRPLNIEVFTVFLVEKIGGMAWDWRTDARGALCKYGLYREGCIIVRPPRAGSVTNIWHSAAAGVCIAFEPWVTLLLLISSLLCYIVVHSDVRWL